MKTFLMIGQSNMAGRGDLKDVSPIEDPLVGVFRMGKFRKLTEPVNVDRAPVAGWVGGVTVSGVSLAPSFAHALAQATGDRVGLIPCADGGTSVTEWQPGGALLENALFQTRLARPDGPLTGILWHQGEADSHSKKEVAAYRDLFMNMYREICDRLERESVPVLIGGLGDFLAERKELPFFRELNGVLQDIAQSLPAAEFVSAKGLGCKPDRLHFNAAAQREFGLRYFEAWKTLTARLAK